MQSNQMDHEMLRHAETESGCEQQYKRGAGSTAVVGNFNGKHDTRHRHTERVQHIAIRPLLRYALVHDTNSTTMYKNTQDRSSQKRWAL